MLLGAGANPWAVNDRGQTPSDVSHTYNANGEVLTLLEQAADMRSVISTGDRSTKHTSTDWVFPIHPGSLVRSTCF